MNEMRKLINIVESGNALTQLVQKLRYDGENELTHEEAAMLANAIYDDEDLTDGHLMSLMAKFDSSVNDSNIWDIKDSLLGEDAISEDENSLALNDLDRAVNEFSDASDAMIQIIDQLGETQFADSVQEHINHIYALLQKLGK